MAFQVTIPAPNRALLSMTDLRISAGLGENRNKDRELDAMGMEVANLIALECQVPSDGVNVPTLRQETLVETVRLSEHRKKIVLSRRFVAVTSIVANGTTLQPDDFEVDASSGIISRLSGDFEACWACGKVIVTYQAGFSEVPDGLKRAAKQAVAEIWSSNSRDPLLKREETDRLGAEEFWVGGLDAKNGAAFSSQVCVMLDHYRCVAAW